MKFSRIEVKNWRNFKSIDSALQSRTFLVGPNAAGKSNFLDVFRFLRDIVSVGGGFQDAVQRRGGVSKLRFSSARESSDILLSVSIEGSDTPSQWTYQLIFNQDKQRRPTIKRERVIKNGEILLERPDEKDVQDVERLTQTFLEQVNANRAFREIATFFTEVRYLHIVPQLVREPERSFGRVGDPFGGDFLERIAAMSETQRNSRLRRIKDALVVAIPQLQAIDLTRDNRGTPHLRMKFQNWRPQGVWFNEDQLSDGTLRLMGLLWATLDGVGPLLLEEPELSLHLEIIRVLPQMFARLQRQTGRQLLISTHSAEMLNSEGIGLDEILTLYPEQEGTSVRLARDIPTVADLTDAGLNLGEIVIQATKPPNVEQVASFLEK